MCKTFNPYLGVIASKDFQCYGGNELSYEMQPFIIQPYLLHMNVISWDIFITSRNAAVLMKTPQTAWKQEHGISEHASDISTNIYLKSAESQNCNKAMFQWVSVQQFHSSLSRKKVCRGINEQKIGSFYRMSQYLDALPINKRASWDNKFYLLSCRCN